MLTPVAKLKRSKHDRGHAQSFYTNGPTRAALDGTAQRGDVRSAFTRKKARSE